MDKMRIGHVPVAGHRPPAIGFEVRPAASNLRPAARGFFLFIFTFFIFNSLGCATYKFQLGKKPYDNGYVVARDGYSILEYTIGQDNSLPADIDLAKERFQRRRRIVEHYYKKMGYIDNHFKMAVWNPCIFTFKTMGGLFRLPFVAISDYRYGHNPEYRARMLRIEEEKELSQEAYIQGLKEKLDGYIEQDIDLGDRSGGVKAAKETRPDQEVVAETLARMERKVAGRKTRSRLKETKDVSSSAKTDLSSQPVAIIIAKPIKGFSPLRVRFYGYKSHAKGGKVVSYNWDFGDGETSTQINPANIYYSGSFEPQYFKATLTVSDAKGNTSEAAVTVEVLNK